MLNCCHQETEFELLSCYYIHFQTNAREKVMNPFTQGTGYIASLLSFCKNGFGIKKPAKVDMPSNKETEADYSLLPASCWFLEEYRVADSWKSSRSQPNQVCDGSAVSVVFCFLFFFCVPIRYTFFFVFFFFLRHSIFTINQKESLLRTYIQSICRFCYVIHPIITKNVLLNSFSYHFSPWNHPIQSWFFVPYCCLWSD